MVREAAAAFALPSTAASTRTLLPLLLLLLLLLLLAALLSRGMIYPGLVVGAGGGDGPAFPVTGDPGAESSGMSLQPSAKLSSKFNSSFSSDHLSKVAVASDMPTLAASISAVGVPVYGGKSDSCILQAAAAVEMRQAFLESTLEESAWLAASISAVGVPV
jgi:hypothetical protein